jgi:hypothetical protein
MLPPRPLELADSSLKAGMSQKPAITANGRLPRPLVLPELNVNIVSAETALDGEVFTSSAIRGWGALPRRRS